MLMNIIEHELLSAMREIRRHQRTGARTMSTDEHDGSMRTRFLSVGLLMPLLWPGTGKTDQPVPVAAEPQSSADVSSILSKVRGGEADGFTATLRGELDVQACMHDATQGLATRGFVVVLSPQATAFMSETLGSGVLGYRQPGHPGYYELDYDENDNLMLWTTQEAHGYCSVDLNRRYETLLKVVIDSRGQFEDFELHHRAQLFELGSGDSIYEVQQIWWASGRGFADSLGSIRSVDEGSQGWIEIVADGTGLTPGTWRLRIDPGAEHLVRHAEYSPPGLQEPTLIVSTSGIVPGDGFSVAQRGVVRFGRTNEPAIEAVVRFSEASGHADPGALQQARDRVFGPLPEGASETVDHRATNPIESAESER